MNFALLFAYTRSIALEATRSLIFRQMWSTVRSNQSVNRAYAGNRPTQLEKKAMSVRVFKQHAD